MLKFSNNFHALIEAVNVQNEWQNGFTTYIAIALNCLATIFDVSLFMGILFLVAEDCGEHSKYVKTTNCNPKCTDLATEKVIQ